MAVYCGIDWAEGHHDIALVDGDGRLVAKRRIDESLDGVAELTAMLAAAGDSAEDADPGRDRDTARAAGRGAARQRSADLPDQPAGGGPVSGTHLGVGQEERPRRRDGVGEHPAHRRAPAPHAARRLAGWPASISVLARAYQDAVWRRTKLVQELRARLREYYPGFLAAFAAGSGSDAGCPPPSWPAATPGRCWRSRPARPTG